MTEPPPEPSPGDATRSRRGAVLFVALVWLVMLISAHGYVHRYGSPVPFADDLSMARPMAYPGTVDAAFLWKPMNEHRVPLARLIYFGLLSVTRDIRSGMYFQVYGLALASLGLLFAARRLRGGTSYADAFFPLLLLNLGNSFNLLMGMQIAVTLPTLALCLVLTILAGGASRLTTRSAVWIGLCLLSLPLSSGVGFTQAPAWTLWFGAAGFAYLRSKRPELARTGVVMSLFATGVVLLTAVYLIGFRFPHTHPEHGGFWESLAASGRFLGMNFGYAGRELWPTSTLGVLAFGLVAAGLLARVFWRQPQERVRAGGLLTCLVAASMLAFAVGWGRGAGGQVSGFGQRYVTMSAPFLVAAYFALVRYAPPQLGRVLCAALCLLMGAAALFNVEGANAYGRTRLERARALQRDVASVMTVKELAARHYKHFHADEEVFARRLKLLRRAGMSPFDQGSEQAGLEGERYPMFATPPTSVVSGQTLARRVEGQLVLGVLPDSELTFAVPRGSTLVEGHFGVLRISREHTSDLRFTVELVHAGGRELLFERTLDPAHDDADRGLQSFSVPLPPGESSTAGELVLGTSVGPSTRTRADWGCWGGVEFR